MAFLWDDTDSIMETAGGETEAEDAADLDVFLRTAELCPARVASGASDPQCGRPGPERGDF